MRGLSEFISVISFGAHGFYDLSFLEAWDDAGQMGFYDDLVLLILEDGFGFGLVVVVNLGNGEGTFYGVAKIYGLLEAKIHSGSQPADLSADLGGQIGNSESVTNSATK